MDIHKIKKLVVERRNSAHVNCIEEKKQAYNDVINLIDNELKDENISPIANKIVQKLGEYVNGLDRRHLGIPLMDEIAVMQMEDIVSQIITDPEKEVEMPEYD